ncbi:MAG: cell division protein FtsQ/DivIB [Kofleriaceae bacterium]
MRRALPGLAGGAAIAALGGGLWLSYWFVTTSDRFAITEIRVTGTDRLTAEDVRRAIPVKIGDNVFATDLDDATRTLRTVPWIASAEAHRELPDTLVVEIQEHVAAAMVELGGLYLVDRSGHAFKRAQIEDGDGEGLPVITGINRATYERDAPGTAKLIAQTLDALDSWRTDTSRPVVGEVHVDQHRALTLRTYDRATAIQLGTLGTELARRMRTFDAAWAELSDSERERAHAIHVGATAPPSTSTSASATPRRAARFDQVTVAFEPTPVLASPSGEPPKERTGSTRL